MRRGAWERGSTLIETLVAIVLVVAAYAAMARGMTAIRSLTSLSRAVITTSAIQHNGALWLREVLLECPVSTDSARYRGDAAAFQFVSAPMHDGAPLPLLVLQLWSDSTMVVTGEGRIIARLSPPLSSFSIDYLFSQGENSPWHSAMRRTGVAPVALRLRFTPVGQHYSDTLVFKVGAA